MISVVTKKKELIGNYKNDGQEWRPAEQPVQVKTHDFPGQAERAIPYGIYVTAANTGWVNIGTDHDTAAFAVASIRRWWQARGQHDYPRARRLLITADAGGSNGYRTRGWKTHLADETGLDITVCHLPPGTSTWNKIEHRLLSHITMNGRGRPLTSHEVMLRTIAATTSRTGLTVHAELDGGQYPTGVQISAETIAALPIIRHRFHGDWNYTLHPADRRPRPDRPQRNRPSADGSHSLMPDELQHPGLTGMTRQQFSDLVNTLIPELEKCREQARHAARGGPRRVARGTGRKPSLTPADQILVTILYLRTHSLQELLGPLQHHRHDHQPCR